MYPLFGEESTCLGFVKDRIFAFSKIFVCRINFYCLLLFFLVPRKFGLPLVFVVLFGLGIPSALDLNILVNQVRGFVVIIIPLLLQLSSLQVMRNPRVSL